MNSIKVTELKKLCKLFRIHGYSKLSKHELVNQINIYHSTLKIQRWIRKILSNGECCPFSCEPIRYPCYFFKMGNKIIYYNLKILRDYLIEYGNFIDSVTMVPYSEHQIKQMDSIYKWYIKKPLEKSVYDYYKNPEYYIQKKKLESDILNCERIIDSSYEEIINYIKMGAGIPTLDLFEMRIFNLFDYSIEHSIYIIDKCIQNLSFLLSKEMDELTNHVINDYNYLLIILFQIKENLMTIS